MTLIISAVWLLFGTVASKQCKVLNKGEWFVALEKPEFKANRHRKLSSVSKSKAICRKLNTLLFFKGLLTVCMVVFANGWLVLQSRSEMVLLSHRNAGYFYLCCSETRKS